ncbi:MAG: beta-propeller domain-containing protein, partial [Syntrophomonadaceae bacterium]|nr:beta-propeller domain-containing protein [Syntrophomonadaceae bacterium]
MINAIKRKCRYIIVTGITALTVLFPSNYAADEPQADVTPQAELKLPVIESLEFLDNLLSEYRARNEREEAYMELFEMAAPVSDSASAGAGAAEYPQAESGSGFSETNVQVDGVDEADMVKTDGEFIYQVKEREVIIVKAPAQGTMVLSARIDMGDEGIDPQDIYVDGNYLVVLGKAEDGVYQDKPRASGDVIYPPYYYRQPVIKAVVYDIADKDNIIVKRKLEMSGSLLSSRKIGESVYMVGLQGINMYREAGEKVLLPAYKDTSSGYVNKELAYNEICYFPGYVRPNFINVAGFNLDGDRELEVRSYLGDGESLYVSERNMYVALTDYNINYDYSSRKADKAEEAREKTVLHRFGLENGSVTYAAAGTVPGRVLNQFSMDENGGYFRIATTLGDTWASEGSNNISGNNIYVLNEDDLLLTGKLEGIAPGERIYSTRFMGDRAYMVTFKDVDPFFVIDMKDPSQPGILGQLKIPGYSDYLHPYDENHIIVFGKDTVQVKGNSG